MCRTIKELSGYGANPHALATVMLIHRVADSDFLNRLNLQIGLRLRADLILVINLFLLSKSAIDLISK